MSPTSIRLPERYAVLRHIANGGMASVWEAHDELLGRDVAIKVLAPHLAEDDRSRRRFQREARTAAGLSNHPNVVTIYDVGEHEGTSFIVMELLRGGNVGDRLKAGTIDRTTALRWLGEAAAALDVAHEAGIVHRDVKPANLLLDEHDRLAIADFGIARIALEDQLTSTGIVLGTAAYIAPEQAEGREAGPASDRYSLAVVAYELLTGRKPFEAEHFAAQARMHLEEPPPRAGLSPALDDALDRGMAKEPEERWPSAVAFVQALQRADTMPQTRSTAPLPPTASVPYASPYRGGRDESRRWAWLILAALAAAAVALALILSSGDGGGGDTTAGNTPEPTATAKPEKKPKAEKTAEPTATATATPAPAAGADIGAARRLQIAGFNANNAGDYQSGLDSSLKAVDACGDTEALDPCGYALYEVGRAYVGLGQNEQAIPYLQRRLDTYGDNASGDVQRLLDQAQGGGAPAPKGNGKAKGKDKGD